MFLGCHCEEQAQHHPVSCSPVPGFPTVPYFVIHHLWGAPKKNLHVRLFFKYAPNTCSPLLSTHFLANCSFLGPFKPQGGNVSWLLALGGFSKHCLFPKLLPVSAISPLMQHSSIIPVWAVSSWDSARSTREENFEKLGNNGIWVPAVQLQEARPACDLVP